MAIIYQPRQVFNLRDEITGGVVAGALEALADFLAGDSKPWAYYVGVGLGTMAAASGIPGATATLYVIGDTLDAVLFKSPDGSNVRFFLNGIAHTSIDTYAAASVWETLNISGLVGGQVNRLDIVNYGPSANQNATGIQWMGLGPVTVYGANAQVIGASLMSVVAIRLQDAESDTALATFPITVPSGKTVVQYQAFADYVAPLLDLVSDSQVVGIQVTLDLTLPAGLKNAPGAGILNERGGLITFDTSGPRADSIWVPGIKLTKMPGDSFALTDADIGNLINAFTQTHAGSTIQPTTVNGFNWTAARKGRKSLRK